MTSEKCWIAAAGQHPAPNSGFVKTTRTFYAVLAGIVLYFMQQIFSMILMFGTGMFQSGDNSVNFFAVTTTIDNTTTSTASILPSSLFVTSNIYSIIVIVILYLVCARIITKHLNLE